MQKPFTGWHMTGILLGSFAVVLAVNVGMARLASSSFSGEVVENSYVASQDFNRWLDEAQASKALGWSVEPTRRADGRVELRMKGVPAGATVSAVARHPLGYQPDQSLAFAAAGSEDFVSTATLPAGRWILRMVVDAGGHDWRGEAQVR